MRRLGFVLGIPLLAVLIFGAPAGAFELAEIAGMTAAVTGRERVKVAGGPRSRRQLTTDLIFEDGFQLHGRGNVTGTPVVTRAGSRRLSLELDAAGRARYEQWLAERFVAVFREAGLAQGPLRASIDRLRLTARVDRKATGVTLVSRVRVTLLDPATGLTRQAKLKHRASGALRGTVQGVIPTPWGPVETEYEVDGDVVRVWDDMLYSREQLLAYEASLEAVETGGVIFSFVDPTRPWPGGRVPYAVADSIQFERDSALQRELMTRIFDAVAHWEERTPLVFERISLLTGTDADPNYVLFTRGIGCSSRVGFQGNGPQNITMTPGCSKGNLIHEIGHAVGLLHEVQRPDRDQYVFVNEGSVREPREGEADPIRNFDISSGGNFVFSRTYDFGSIMHYGADFFARDDLDFFDPLPIVPKVALPPGVVMGQREALSEGDLQAIEAIYGERGTSSCSQGGCSDAWLEGFDFDPDLSDFRSVERRAGDFDGDGRDDLVSFARDAIPGARGRVRVALAADSLFSIGTDHFRDAGVWHENFCSFEQDVCEVGDFNGDGLSDIAWIVPSTGEVLVSLNEGGAFGPAESWHHRVASQGVRFAVGNFDGRGGDDLAVFSDAGEVFMVVSEGNRFENPLLLAEPRALGVCGQFQLCHAADYDGDGDDDLVAFGSDGGLELLEAFRQVNDPGLFEVFEVEATLRSARAIIPTLELFPSTPAFLHHANVASNVCPFDAVCATANLSGTAGDNQLVTFLADPLGPVGVASRTLRASDLAVTFSALSETLFCGRADGCLLADVDGDGRDEVIDVVDQTRTLPFPRARGTVFVSGGGGFAGPVGGAELSLEALLP